MEVEGQTETKQVSEVKPTTVDKRGRIVVRNLPFDMNEKMLRKLFAEHGAISEVCSPDTDSNQSAKWTSTRLRVCAII